MIHSRKSVLVACSALLCLGLPLADSKAQENTTQVQIQDDGYAEVPLPFVFPYYGLTFSNSWMYDNGVISFINPSDPYALSPYNWNASNPATQPGIGNYFIAALWADIAPMNGITQYSYTTDGLSYMKYNWENIAEYYSRNTGAERYNSFSIKIDDQGSVLANYTLLNLNTSNLVVGTYGDTSKGEINTVYSVPFGTQVSLGDKGGLADWSYLGTPVPPPEPVDPCGATGYLTDPTCPGYVSPVTTTAVVETTTTTPTQTYELVGPVTTPTADPVTTTVQETQTTAAPVVSPTPTANNPQPLVGEVTVAGDSKPKGQGASMSTIMSVIANEQARIAETEAQVAAEVKTIEQQAIAQSEAVAEQSARESQMVVAAQGGAIGGSVNTGTAIDPAAAYGVPSIAATPSSIVMTNASPQATMMQGPMSATESATPQYASLNDDIATKDLFNSQPITIEDLAQSKSSTVKRNVKDNELAGDVKIEKIAIVPLGFEAYSIAMVDVKFYPSTQVYRNQKTVDNARALRMLSGKNDVLHQQMVDMQYK